MKIYRTTRYDKDGKIVWQRFGTKTQPYGATSGDIGSRYSHYGREGYKDRVTLEVVEVSEPQWELLKSYPPVDTA